MFFERLQQLIKEKGITQKQMCDDIQINKNLPKYWKDNNTHPNKTILNSLASYFDVSVDYLLGITDIKKEITPTEYSEGEQALIELFNKIPKEKKELVLNMIKAALENL